MKHVPRARHAFSSAAFVSLFADLALLMMWFVIASLAFFVRATPDVHSRIAKILLVLGVAFPQLVLLMARVVSFARIDFSKAEVDTAANAPAVFRQIAFVSHIRGARLYFALGYVGSLLALLYTFGALTIWLAACGVEVPLSATLFVAAVVSTTALFGATLYVYRAGIAQPFQRYFNNDEWATDRSTQMRKQLGI